MNYLNKYGVIYKITNIENNKIYIGQTIKYYPRDRFTRHINDALNHITDTYLSRAICKYGRNSFKFEIIDVANTQQELDNKEKYYIKKYNTTNSTIGYSLTDGGISSGGNTYKYKTEEEMKKISEKIRISKLGANNPNHKSVKQTDILTGEIMIFGSQMECARYHNKASKDFVRKRCSRQILSPYKNRYVFEYYEE